MSQQHYRPPHHSKTSGYNRNSEHKPRGGIFNRINHHTRPNRPPKYNLSIVRSHIIKDEDDVCLEQNRPTTAATSGRNTFSMKNDRGGHKHHNRRVTIMDRVKHMGGELKQPERLAIGETQPVKQLPISKPHCELSNLPPNVFNGIANFVEKYLICFDTNRDSLLEAYHPKAIFSFSINVNNNASFQNNYRSNYRREQIKESRNLNRIPPTDVEKRFRLLHVGHIDTVNFIRNLQPTEHIKESLKLDVSFFMPHLLIFSVDGVFKEGAKDAKMISYRAFQRVFACIPLSHGRIGIINEQLSISNMSNDQFKNYTKEETTATANIVREITVSPEEMLQNERNSKIERFSIATKLTTKWCHDCLECLEWDYNKALEEYNNQKHKIPSDAYIQ